MDLKLRCSSSGCPCTHFTTSKENLRVCDGCSHSWLAHLFEKLLRNDETLSIFDVCSLALYGTHALPIRLKIVIERLLSTLQPEETDKILQSFGWTSMDLARGYMIHDSEGCFLNKWSILPRDEEPLVLEQFLRFGPTHSLTFALLRKELSPPPPSLTSQSTGTTFTLSPKTAAMISGGSGSIPVDGIGNQGSFFTNNNNHHHTNNHHTSRLLRSPSSTNVRGSSPSKSENAGDRDTCGGSVLNLSTSGPSSAADSSVGSHSGGDDDDDDDDVGIMVQDGEVVEEDNGEDSNDEGGNEGCNGNDDGRREREQESSTAVDLSSNSKSTIESPSSASPNSLDLGIMSKIYDHEMSTRSGPGLMNAMRSATSIESKTMRNHEQPSHRGPGRKPKYGSSVSSKQAWATAAIAASVTVNPATGKRRVLCSVCQKTFCDKGALKIHFSAVHLREMHKCTVNGCTMMFSSRRSRNRHSANPNPKLHSPHIRRKISPNDGRSGSSSRHSLSNHVPLNVHQHHRGSGASGNGSMGTSLLPGTNLLAPRFSPPTTAASLASSFGPIIPPSFNLGGSSGVVSSSSSSMDGNDDHGRAADDHHNPAILSAAVNEILRKNGARKRKLSNPIRVPNNMDFGSFGVAAAADMSKLMKDASSEASHQLLNSHLNQLLMMRGMLGNSLGEATRNKDRVSPNQRGDESPIESRGSSPGDLFVNNPLAVLASKVFQFNPQYQNLPFSPTMTEKLYESLFAGKRAGTGTDLMDKKSQSKLNNNNILEHDESSASIERTAV